ncbi:MAG: hypothetical protein OXF23_03180 [Candidatus Dadabacteria bacterium]|nr:hypothetical protein [Candidatus Dadabacteria bacterium]MCY4262068.1 hypothetical protein [Candidatus Dadabacteria bacterium]
MAGKIYIRKGRIPFFSLPFIGLFVIVAVCLFTFFGVLTLVALGLLGAGASVLRKLFLGKDNKTSPRMSREEKDSITLGEDDYRIRDID